MAELWKGAPAAAALTEKLAVQAAALRQAGVVPALAIVRWGSGRRICPMSGEP